MSTKRPYTPPVMEIDIFEENSFIRSDNRELSGGEYERPGGDPVSPELPGFVDDVVAADAPFVDEPFIEEPAAPEIDLDVPQIGVPVFTLDPVVGTDPTADVMGGDGAGE